MRFELRYLNATIDKVECKKNTEIRMALSYFILGNHVF